MISFFQFSALWQDQNNKNTGNVLGKEVPCNQSPQATLSSTNPQNAKLKNRQLNVTNARLSEKEQEISKLQERIKLLEKNNQRQQQVIEMTRLVFYKSQIFPLEYEKREWSIERERLSMELNDVTRELDLQKMLLNGESISEIVQRVADNYDLQWEVKVFELEGMVADRDAAIRAQQQRIGELKQAATRGGGELSSNESIISQQAATKTDPATLAHLKRIIHQCSRR
uniref:Uncharacterized protein n=1 Tax=Parascaris equorum TaxID=6256 RepID=A0A914S9I0_PAREQ